MPAAYRRFQPQRLAWFLAGLFWLAWLGYEDRGLTAVVLLAGCLGAALGLTDWARWGEVQAGGWPAAVRGALLGALAGASVEALGVAVHLHTGTRKTMAAAPPRSPPLDKIPAGAPPGGRPRPTLVIGTHALIEAGFTLQRLGLVIIDEQHKFGVTQREQLVRIGRYPHLLVMTATPIPRTLGLTLYGDLDLSTIDALPPGRGRLRTFVRSPDRLPRVWAYVREQLAQGRQAYVVCPRIEENDRDTLTTVTAEYARVQPWRRCCISAIWPDPEKLLHLRGTTLSRPSAVWAFPAGRHPRIISLSTAGRMSDPCAPVC